MLSSSASADDPDVGVSTSTTRTTALPSSTFRTLSWSQSPFVPRAVADNAGDDAVAGPANASQNADPILDNSVWLARLASIACWEWISGLLLLREEVGAVEYGTEVDREDPGILPERRAESVGEACLAVSRSLLGMDDVVKNAGRSALVSWLCAVELTCCRCCTWCAPASRAMRPQSCMRYASSVFSVNGLRSANASKFEPRLGCWNGESGNLGLGVVVPTPPKHGRFKAGLIFSCWSRCDCFSVNAGKSGTRVACTGVIPPAPPKAVLLPPQKARAGVARGLVGRSFWVLGLASVRVLRLVFVTEGVAVRGAGGGRTGLARPSSMARLSASTSCLSATFSSFVEPSSSRMASIRRSRSAMSPSSVVIYSGYSIQIYETH